MGKREKGGRAAFVLAVEVVVTVRAKNTSMQEDSSPYPTASVYALGSVLGGGWLCPNGFG